VMTQDNSGFVISKSKDGQYYFVLKARDGHVLVTSETYTTKQSAESGIRAVRGTATAAKVVDTTTGG
jgi:uncharacterized protein